MTKCVLLVVLESSERKEKTRSETTLPDGRSILFYRRSIEEYFF